MTNSSGIPERLEALAEALLLGGAPTPALLGAAHELLSDISKHPGLGNDDSRQFAETLAAACAGAATETPPTQNELILALRYLHDVCCRGLAPLPPRHLRQNLQTQSSSPVLESRPATVDAETWRLFLSPEFDPMPALETELAHYRHDGDGGHIREVRQSFHRLKGEAGFCGIPTLVTLAGEAEAMPDHPPADLLERLARIVEWTGAVFAALRANIPLPEPPGLRPAEPAPPLAAASGSETEYISVSDPELARDFVTEAREHCEKADQALLALEVQPDSPEAINAVFRTFHTIKGIAGFLAIQSVRDLCHEVETLLDAVRKGQRAFTGRTTELTFRALDELKVLVEAVDQRLTTSEQIPVPATVQPLIRQLAEMMTMPHAESPREIDGTPAASISSDASIAAAPALQAADVGQNPATTQNVMRVAAAKLDQLLDTIGELVIAESVVTEDSTLRTVSSPRMEQNINQLRKITRSLQSMSLALRMVPVDGLFRKMSRLVRDLAKQTGKPVALQLEGTEIEVDKAIVERLNDPLIHMIRNAIDHGIEPDPAGRILAGKPSEATLILRARQRGANIHISISDDGRGLQRELLLKRGVELGMVQDPDNASDADVFSLIFQPGFSTATTITDVSGRGVGLDVVKRDIMAIRGAITVDSTPGKGTTFTIILPLTLAIIDGMLVTIGEDTYVVPMLSILECFKPSSGQIHTPVGRAQMVEFRGRHLPLVRAGDILNLSMKATHPHDGIVIAIEDGSHQIALLVDTLSGQQQTIIKPLGAGLGNVPGLAGATILGNGNPAMVFDIGGIIALARGQGRQPTFESVQTQGAST